MTVHDLLNRLDGVKRSGDGWTARCPAHDDEHNSLSVRDGEGGKIIVRCHAGCTANSIMAALGLTMRDLFPPRGERYSASRFPTKTPYKRF